MNKKTEITVKSTKEQIFTAYQEVLAQLESKEILDPVSEKRKSQEQETVTKASKNSSENIVSNLANLKININKELDSLSNLLIDEFNKLIEIRGAIIIEQKHLKDLYEINETAQTLSALILAQQEKKENFEKKMREETEAFEKEKAAKKEQWKQQEETLKASYKSFEEELEKTRKRNEEEYKYNVELTRRKDADSYANKKAVLESELNKLRFEHSEREELLKSREQEYLELKQKVEEFPQELMKSKETAEEVLRSQLEMQHKFASDLLAKEIEGERKLNEQKIVALEKKIKEQDQLINQLTQKADNAVSQIQSIACKALDTSGQRFIGHNNYLDEKQGVQKG